MKVTARTVGSRQDIANRDEGDGWIDWKIAVSARLNGRAGIVDGRVSLWTVAGHGRRLQFRCIKWETHATGPPPWELGLLYRLSRSVVISSSSSDVDCDSM